MQQLFIVGELADQGEDQGHVGGLRRSQGQHERKSILPARQDAAASAG